MKKTYTSFDELPITLNANDIASILGVSRVGAYNLLNSDGFPTIRIGKRMMVSKEKLLEWIEEKSYENKKEV